MASDLAFELIHFGWSKKLEKQNRYNCIDEPEFLVLGQLTREYLIAAHRKSPARRSGWKACCMLRRASGYGNQASVWSDASVTIIRVSG